VRAGLVSSLRWNKQSTEWQIYVLTPTAHSLEAVAASLVGENAQETSILGKALLKDPAGLADFVKQRAQPQKQISLLFVVDQFEEVFTLCHSEEERTSFIDHLLTAAFDPTSP
jgi:hypothetical protein